MNTVKSQDDIKKPENRSSDVLIKTIERCQELEEENQQLKELHKRLKDTQNLELEVRRENQQLKNLLKECKYELRGCYTDIGWEDWSFINKIDKAIGEK